MGATHYLLLAAVTGYEHLESQAIDIVPSERVNVSLQDLQPLIKAGPVQALGKGPAQPGLWKT